MGTIRFRYNYFNLYIDSPTETLSVKTEIVRHKKRDSLLKGWVGHICPGYWTSTAWDARAECALRELLGQSQLLHPGALVLYRLYLLSSSFLCSFYRSTAIFTGIGHYSHLEAFNLMSVFITILLLQSADFKIDFHPLQRPLGSFLCYQQDLRSYRYFE